MEGAGGKPDGDEHDAFKDWQDKRNAAALALVADVEEGAKLWLARVGADGEGFAEHVLAATGKLRAEARAGAAAEARLGVAMLPDQPVLTIDARGGSPPGALRLLCV